MRNLLSPPDAAVLAHSARLAASIAEEIRAGAGWIGFDRFMARALYTPGLGYYSGGARKFGAEGDFVTAPEISPLFGRALAAQVAQVMAASNAEIIEVGAGSGALACDLLAELAARGELPTRYAILELSGELRARQAATLRERVPELAERVVWLDGLPESFAGCVLANEVLDAMPVQLAVWRDGAIFERGVCEPPACSSGARLPPEGAKKVLGRPGDFLARLDAAGAFCWQDRPATGRLLAAAQARPVAMPEEGEYLSEIGLAAQAWVAEWAPRLAQGALLLIDYGYPQAEYYLPQRSRGTLQGYFRHQVQPDVLRWPGLCDITSFVDFTALADAAYAAGLTVAGYTTQASFLTNCGLLELLAGVGPSESAAYLRAAHAASRLIAPHEMGELFKVLVLTRGLDLPLLGLARGDRTHTL